MLNRVLSLIVISSFMLVGCGKKDGDSSLLSSSHAKPGTQEDLAQNVGDRVFFDLNSSEIREDGQSTLQQQASWLAKYPNITIQVEGHCDERGTREFNLALGDRRATKVKEYLVTLGVQPSRIQTISYGKERIAVVGENEEAHAQNRRGVSVVTKN